MKGLTKREKGLLFGVLIIAVFYLFMNYVYTPINNEVKELRENSKNLTIKMKDIQSKQKLVQTMKEEISTLQKNIFTNHKDIFTVWDDPELLVYIENSIDNFSVIEEVEYVGELPLEGYCSGDINIKLITDYNNLKKLLEEFEKYKYFSTVQLIDIFREKEETVEPSDQSVNENGVEEDNHIEKSAEDEKNPKLNDYDEILNVNLVLRFYSRNIGHEYPLEYDFMNGEYHKTDIFK